MKKYLGIFVIAGLILIIGSENLTAQCAMCKQAAASTLDKNPGSMARSLNSGILYLMVFPYILLAFIFRKQIKELYFKVKAKFSH